MSIPTPRIAVVIPSYKVTRHIIGVIAGIGPEVSRIYVVDDKCPDHSGQFVREHCADPRVQVIEHAENQGVGGAVMSGYQAAIAEGVDIIVKVDGDGQMDARLIPDFVAPIVNGEADYTKGNRFFDLHLLRGMPGLRMFGNACLSFVNKLSSGYWDIMDPTNGFTAIGRAALERLDLDRIEPRYFFESDMLFRLALIRAVVQDVPMRAIYGAERSGLRIGRATGEFLRKNLRRIVLRFFYLYVLRDFNFGGLNTLCGIPMMLFGLTFGLWHWVGSLRTGIPATTGTVMLAVLPIILGFQLLLSAIGYDIGNRPTVPLQRMLPDLRSEE